MEIASQAQHPDESKKQSPQKSDLATGLILEDLLIPLEEIKLATKNFDPENKIYKRAEFGVVYIGELSKRWKNRKAAFKCYIEDRGCSLYTLPQVKKGFLNELKFISSFNHESIIPFIGYCNEGNNMIIVYDYSENGSLHDHLNIENKKSCLTWALRLQICIDVAKGLNYLHSGLGERGKVIHGFVTDSNILLDDNLKGKICGFEFSALIPGNELRVYKPSHTRIDPVSLATGFLKTQSDVYSFGALLFQIMNRPGSISDGWSTKADGGHVIDPLTGDKISGRSFYMIKELARNCITYGIKDRPTIDTIIKTVEEALDINDTTSITKESSEYQNPRNLIIPNKEIMQAARNIRVIHPQDSNETIHIGPWKNRTAIINIYALKDHFETEFDIISRFHHPNIVSFIGCREEYRRNTLVYEHPFNGRLVDHLQDPHKRQRLTWEQRLKICIGAARALKCLHSGLWEENRVVHRHFRSEIIFLDENMEAKISEFGKAILVPKNQSQVRVNLAKKGVDKDYEDPIYLETEIVNLEMDVYSFGVVMFEVLGGSKASERRKLIKRVYRDYDCGLEKLIDPCIKDQIDVRSLHTFAQAAYRCLSFNLNERPSMNRIIKRIEEALYFQNYRSASTSTTTIRSQQYQKLEDLIIPLNEINLATGNFNENSKIGKGGFGVVYKGQLSKRWPDLQVAIKRLNKTSHQAKTDFQNELELISRFNHQNIIHFIGYCEEGDEMLLVYEYAINGSLEDHLEIPSKIGCLTWAQRLKICLGAAKGLDYLHTGLGEDYRVIHRDVKSGNILLDENLEAKICDFGFSKPDSAKTLKQSKLYTKVAGTKFYLDPIYHESGILRTESDVYSFGVVMLEMLSGMPAWRVKSFGHDKPQPLINLVRRYYDYGKELLIDPQIKAHIEKNSFHTFIDIAYRCISFNSKERPTMETIADKIEEALDFQVQKDVSGNGD